MTEQNGIDENDTEKDRKILGVLIHELAHQYGAIDHYHEEDENGNCIRLNVCSDCNGKNARPKDCIMKDARLPGLETMSGDELFCIECKNDILTHLNAHH